MIKIKEEFVGQDEKDRKIGQIKIELENKVETTFDSYPIVVLSNDVKYIHYEVQKKQSHSNETGKEKSGILDKAKEKALEFKDTVVDTTKEQSKE